MPKFIERVISWNSKRYSQIFSSALTFSLLDEENLELLDAEQAVDKVDALVDIIYVATGALWKLGLNAEQIERALMIVCDSNDSKSVAKTDPHIKANTDKGSSFIPPENRLQLILDEAGIQ